MALRFLLRFPAFSQKEQNGPPFTFPWRFQKFLATLGEVGRVCVIWCCCCKCKCGWGRLVACVLFGVVVVVSVSQYRVAMPGYFSIPSIDAALCYHQHPHQVFFVKSAPGQYRY